MSSTALNSVESGDWRKRIFNNQQARLVGDTKRPATIICQQRVKSDPLTVTTNGLILIHLVYSGLASAITPAFEEWTTPALAAEYKDIPALLIKKSQLVRGFDKAGWLRYPVECLFNSNNDMLVDVLGQYEMPYQTECVDADFHRLVLLPS